MLSVFKELPFDFFDESDLPGKIFQNLKV